MSLRGIGSRSGAAPVERVNRDGEIEVLELSDVEVTPRDRMNWYSKAKIDQRGRTPEEIFGSEKDDGGNPLSVEGGPRTRLPRTHQHSTESRLTEWRGEECEFPVSEADETRAKGLIPPAEKLGEKAASFCKAFEMVVGTLHGNEVLDNRRVITIGQTTGLSLREVFALKEIAENNKDLREKYARIRTRKRKPKRDREKDQSCCGDLPGLMPKRKQKKIAPGRLGKETDEELDADTLLEVAQEVGL